MDWNDIINFAHVGVPEPDKKVVKSETEWKEILSEEAFRVTRKAGTERPFTGEHCHSYEQGIYACACCGTPLFNSEIKFNSKSGWPSFTEPLTGNAVKYHLDNSLGMERIEAVCNTCDAHLGHVFPDGPPPTGLRYCINSVSLELVKEEE